MAKAKSVPKSTKAAPVSDSRIADKKPREQRNFPACSFEEALELAKAIEENAGNQPIRRLTLFDAIGRAPESGPSRQLITNSSKYGLITGGYQAEYLQLTENGYKVTNNEVPEVESLKAKYDLAINTIEPFIKVYEKNVGNKLPSLAVLKDQIIEAGVSASLADEAIEIFILNLKHIGLLKTLSGAERIVSVDFVIEEKLGKAKGAVLDTAARVEVQSKALITQPEAHFESTCFYITPIGDEGSEYRKHSDLFLGTFIEPAVEPFKLRVIRADQIDKPGVITKQVISYLLKSRLVIADLSFHNPNVFYELAIRHACRMPTVQIIRSSDKIPFDIGQLRTVKIDCTDIFSLVPKIETYKTEITNQIRRALEDPDATDNPITIFYPDFKVSI